MLVRPLHRAASRAFSIRLPNRGFLPSKAEIPKLTARIGIGKNVSCGGQVMVVHRRFADNDGRVHGFECGAVIRRAVHRTTVSGRRCRSRDQTRVTQFSLDLTFATDLPMSASGRGCVETQILTVLASCVLPASGFLVNVPIGDALEALCRCHGPSDAFKWN